mgnify:CR=1 FL=1
MSLVVDASVAVKWVVEEHGRPAARLILLGDEELVAPEFLLVEASNVLRSKVMRGQFPEEDTTAAYDTIRSGIDRFVPDEALASEALELSLRLGHSAYDCVYLACARQLDAELITADQKLVGKLRGLPEWSRVRFLTA